MAVSFVIAGENHAGTPSTVTISLDVSTGSTRAAMVAVGYSNGATVSSVTVGTDSLSLVTGTQGTSSGGTMSAEIWGGILTVTGTQTITVTMSSTGSAVVNVIAVIASSVDQTTPINNGTREDTGALTISITSNSGDMTVDFMSSLNSDISAPTQTQRELVNTGGFRYASSTGPGTAGPISHAWTVSSYLSQVAQSGANFNQAAAGGPTVPQEMPGVQNWPIDWGPRYV